LILRAGRLVWRAATTCSTVFPTPFVLYAKPVFQAIDNLLGDETRADINKATLDAQLEVARTQATHKLKTRVLGTWAAFLEDNNFDAHAVLVETLHSAGVNDHILGVSKS
jgi:hypothetical protein